MKSKVKIGNRLDFLIKIPDVFFINIIIMIMVMIAGYHLIYDIDIADVLVILRSPNRYGRKSAEKPPKNSPGGIQASKIGSGSLAGKCRKDTCKRKP